jgi:hypothetical protein
MYLKLFFVAGAVLSLLFGAGFVLNPQLVIEQHGMTANDGFRMMMRPMGGALLGYAMIFWWVRNAPVSATLTAIVRGAFLFHLIAFGGTAYGIATGVMNAMGWGPVLIHLGLALGFGYYSFRPAATAGPTPSA